MTRRRDLAEAATSTLVGLGVSLALVEALRLAGLWDAPSWALSVLFTLASLARSYALRRLFRAMEGRR